MFWLHYIVAAYCQLITTKLAAYPAAFLRAGYFGKRRHNKETLLMKIKYIIALVLILAGTNLFSYAATRYATTESVLIQAGNRTTDFLEKEGILKADGIDNLPLRNGILIRIHTAGGIYFWGNDGRVLCLLGGVLTAIGIVVTRYEPARKQQQ